MDLGLTANPYDLLDPLSDLCLDVILNLLVCVDERGPLVQVFPEPVDLGFRECTWSSRFTWRSRSSGGEEGRRL
jgi:hypothetical protein